MINYGILAAIGTRFAATEGDFHARSGSRDENEVAQGGDLTHAAR